MKADKLYVRREQLDKVVGAELKSWAARQSPPVGDHSDLLRRAAFELPSRLEESPPHRGIRGFFQNKLAIMPADHPIGRPFHFGVQSNHDMWSWAWSLHMASSIHLAA
jgi:hypothetical protein